MKNPKIFALGAITTICFSLTGCDFNSNKEEKPIILNVYRRDNMVGAHYSNLTYTNRKFYENGSKVNNGLTMRD